MRSCQLLPAQRPLAGVVADQRCEAGRSSPPVRTGPRLRRCKAVEGSRFLTGRAMECSAALHSGALFAAWSQQGLLCRLSCSIQEVAKETEKTHKPRHHFAPVASSPLAAKQAPPPNIQEPLPPFSAVLAKDSSSRLVAQLVVGSAVFLLGVSVTAVISLISPDWQSVMSRQLEAVAEEALDRRAVEQRMAQQDIAESFRKGCGGAACVASLLRPSSELEALGLLGAVATGIVSRRRGRMMKELEELVAAAEEQKRRSAAIVATLQNELKQQESVLSEILRGEEVSPEARAVLLRAKTAESQRDYAERASIGSREWMGAMRGAGSRWLGVSKHGNEQPFKTSPSAAAASTSAAVPVKRTASTLKDGGLRSRKQGQQSLRGFVDLSSSGRGMLSEEVGPSQADLSEGKRRWRAPGSSSQQAREGGMVGGMQVVAERTRPRPKSSASAVDEELERRHRGGASSSGRVQPARHDGQRKGWSRGKGAAAVQYVVPDTNCYMRHMTDVKQLKRLADVQTVVPLAVLGELDGLQGAADPRTSFAARKAIRYLSQEMQSGVGWLRGQQRSELRCLVHGGVTVGSEGRSGKESESAEEREVRRWRQEVLEPVANVALADDEIVDCCVHFSADGQVTLLTDDKALQVKAMFHSVKALPLREFLDAFWAEGRRSDRVDHRVKPHSS